MSDDDDGNVRNLVANSLDGHSKRYKSYLTKLKQGGASGISQQFGRAADLLPASAQKKSGQNLFQDPFQNSYSFYSSTLNSRNSPTLRVVSPTDQWLWDVFYDENAEVWLVKMADGSLIARAEDGINMVLVQKRASHPDSPRIVILENIIVNPLTGNIYWQGATASTAGAFLNNGWQIDQMNGDDLEPRSFVLTEPQTNEGAPRRQHLVSALNIDLDNGDVTFEMPDSGQSVTLRSRKIVAVT